MQRDAARPKTGRPSEVRDVILAAMADLAGAELDIALEDLVVRVWQRLPATFGLRGYTAHYPDSNKVITHIVGARGLVAKGYLVKTGPKRYRLPTSGGRDDGGRRWAHVTARSRPRPGVSACPSGNTAERIELGLKWCTGCKLSHASAISAPAAVAASSSTPSAAIAGAGSTSICADRLAEPARAGPRRGSVAARLHGLTQRAQTRPDGPARRRPDTDGGRAAKIGCTRLLQTRPDGPAGKRGQEDAAWHRRSLTTRARRV